MRLYPRVRRAASYWEVGAEASVLFPRFLFPFVNESFKRRVRASTELKVSYGIQTRPEYRRAILSGGWSYIWQERSNTQARHVFKLLDIDYVHLPKIDHDFERVCQTLPGYIIFRTSLSLVPVIPIHLQL